MAPRPQTRRRGRSWRPPSPTSGRSVRRAPSSRRRTGSPRSSSSRRPTSWPDWRRADGPARSWSGFAAETHDARRARARRKLERKGVDLLVVNDVSAPGAGFDHDTNAVVILEADGRRTEIPLTSKDAVANGVLDRVIAHYKEKRSSHVRTTFTSESVTEGHPDKMADQISDAVLDAMLEGDPIEPRRLRDAPHHRTGRRRGRGDDLDLRRHSRARARHGVRHRVRQRRLRLQRQDLRRARVARRAVAGHRAGRRRRVRAPERQGGRGHAQRAGRGRPGDDVRLRLRRDAGPDAAADLAGPPPVRAAGPGAPGRRPCPTCGPTARPRCRSSTRTGGPVRIDTVLDLDAARERASTSRSSCGPT